MSISGPTEYNFFGEMRSYVKYQYKTSPPVDGALREAAPYRFVISDKVVAQGPYAGTIASYNQPNWAAVWYGSGSEDAVNRARNKFISGLGERAEMAVNLAERRQAVDMMAKRLMTMYHSLKLLRSGRALAAARRLGIRYTRKPYVAVEDAANLWLEWHFGWSPLLADIHTGIEILSNPFRRVKVKGRGSCGWSYNSGVQGTPYQWFTTSVGNWKAQVGAVAYTENPNLLLATELGIINPAVIAWELVPFSFVVDWFVPVGQYLNSYTDLTNVELLEPYTTIRCPESLWTSSYIEPPYHGLPGSTTSIVIKTHGMTRSLGIPDVKIIWAPPHGLSLSRAATALALTVQQLKRFKF